MAEIWDAYDRDFNKIENVRLIRGEQIPDGMYHLACDIIVRHSDGSYLLMKRDLKKTYGGRWEITAGGSALAGEAPFEAAMRELREETGIISTNLKEIKRIVNEQRRFFCVVYFCITDCDKTSVTLQEGETIDYKWATREEILKMDPESIASVRVMELIKNDEL